MNPMEHMLISMVGKLTGLSPEEMQAMATKAMGRLEGLDGRLSRIEEVANAIRPILPAPVAAVVDTAETVAPIAHEFVASGEAVLSTVAPTLAEAPAAAPFVHANMTGSNFDDGFGNH